MKTFKQTVFITICVFLFSALITYSQNTESIGTLKDPGGTCEIERNAGKMDCKEGGEVFIDDAFTLGSNSGVTISFIDETKITLGENSYLEVDEFVFNPKERKNITKILKGKMRATINTYQDRNSDVEFKTANAVAGVKGTILYIDADKELFSVREGTVALRSIYADTKPIILKAGQFSRVINGIPQIPQNMNDRMWQEFDEVIDRNVWDKLPPEAEEIKRKLPINIKKPKFF